MSLNLDVPIAFIVFNRPELTSRVFECIREARPRQLFVIADGPRRSEEREVCEQARAIATNVDWGCVVQTYFSEANLGCGQRVSSGLDWVFEQCEQAIILEDDCIPDPTFFPYCAELLEKYKDDHRVAMVSGNNFLQGFDATNKLPASYYFSRFTHTWGWATWRRAWSNYDFEMKRWPAVRKTIWLQQLLESPPQFRRWQRLFDAVYTRTLDTWDFQWQYSVFRTGSVAIMPAVNLISNIGFGSAATHTKTVNSLSCIEKRPMGFPLKHPDAVEADRARDDYTFLAKSKEADRTTNTGLRSITNLSFPAIGQWIRVLRLLPKIPNAPLLLALTRLHVWPDANDYDKKTGRLFLRSRGMTVWMDKELGLLAEPAVIDCS